MSVNDVYRSLHAMSLGNRAGAYRLPDSLPEMERLRRLADRMPASATEVLLSKNRDKARIAARMRDVGRDTVIKIQAALSNWVAQNIDSSVVRFKMTGTGLILDKNSVYIRNNMLQGLYGIELRIKCVFVAISNAQVLIK